LRWNEELTPPDKIGYPRGNIRQKRFAVGKCSKSKKVKKPKKPRFTCEKCGARADEKKQVCKPEKLKKKD
jgi:hypothetical protein